MIDTAETLKRMRLHGSTDPGAFCIGGSAVNAWAEHYLAKVPSLGAFRPFFSKDVDAWTSVAVPIPAPESGIVSHSPLLEGELFAWVPGLPEADLSSHVLVLDGLRLASPPLMLKSKLWNLLHLPQEGRQDLRHCLILLQLLPHFLEDARFPHPSRQTKLLDEWLSEQTLHALDALGLSKGWNDAAVFQNVRLSSSPRRVYVPCYVPHAVRNNLADGLGGTMIHEMAPRQSGSLIVLPDHADQQRWLERCEALLQPHADLLSQNYERHLASQQGQNTILSPLPPDDRLTP